MPLSGEKYVAPVWKDNAPPALDAAELQAMTDAIERTEASIGDVTTPAQKMGLTGNLSVGAALGVLADVGNVHVWKKSTLISNEMQAGYSLGAVKNGTFFVTPVNAVNSTGNWDYADSITVNSEGEYTLVNSENINYRGTKTYLEYWENLKGKFARHNSGARDFAENTLYFIPENATIAYDDTQFSTYTNKYQEVNLQKHIPAKYEVTFLTSTDPNAYQEGAAGNSTIEYLGTLGDRARIEVGSYVGTGVYGKTNPNSLTFAFPPKFVCISGLSTSLGILDFICFPYAVPIAHSGGYSTSNKAFRFDVVEWESKTVTWYTTNNHPGTQANSPNETYYYFAIG